MIDYYQGRLFDSIIPKVFCTIPTVVNDKPTKLNYLMIGSGFDIETTTVNKMSFMYHWQFSLNNNVYLGRTWDSFLDFLSKLNVKLNLKENQRLLIYIANLGFEFSFLRKKLNFTEAMFKDERHPLKLVVDNWLEIRDALAISGGSLDDLAKSYTTTQKLKGDLDYSILRNSKTPLTEKELQYCINDVVILKEFSEYVFEKFGNQGYLPLTKTGMLRHKVKELCKADYDFKKLRYVVKNLYPKNRQWYEYIMAYLFKGGYTHGMLKAHGKVFKNLDSWDKKSSYPSSELGELYPMSSFIEFDSSNFDEYIKKFHVIFIAEFTNFRATTEHSIISLHKSIVTGKKIVDNGRIVFAEKIQLFLCEVELTSLNRFYNFNEMNIIYCAYATKGHLPNYLINPMIEAFVAKENLPKRSREYSLQKSYLNSNFGMCVTRLKFKDFIINNFGEIVEKESKSYESQITNQILSPFWGIYITAYSREDLLDVLWNCQESYYLDTDSTKVPSGKYDEFFKLKNIQIREKMKKGCDYYGIDYELIKGIGEYQKEATLKRFKHLGCKRYIVEFNDGTFESTVSGLKKDAFIKWCSEKNEDPVDAFTDGLFIPKEFEPKKTAYYCDEPYEAIVNGELMCEDCGVTIVSSDYSLKDKDDVGQLISKIEEKLKRGVVI